MTLPTSGALSLSQIHGEFGHGEKLSDYVGKTWHKADGSSGTFANPVKISDFYGTSKVMLLFKQTYTFTSDYPGPISAYFWARNDGWDEAIPVDLTFNISAKTSGFSDRTIWPLPAGSKLRVNISDTGTIYGSGGLGASSGGGIFGGNGPGGHPGGDAVNIVDTPTTIDNQGTIAGGGGGGGGGAGSVSPSVYGGPGGGGAGFPGGTAGSNYGNSGAASNGTASAGGAGGAGDSGRGAGGTGGALASVGSSGNSYSSFSGGPGGPAGRAVVGNSNITWINTGTRTGAILS